MSKQDRVYTRTAADLERKYNFDQKFKESTNAAARAQAAAEAAAQSAAQVNSIMTQQGIFNLLTNNGQAQAFIMGEDGEIYVNANFIIPGIVTLWESAPTNLSDLTVPLDMSGYKYLLIEFVRSSIDLVIVSMIVSTEAGRTYEVVSSTSSKEFTINEDSIYFSNAGDACLPIKIVGIR